MHTMMNKRSEAILLALIVIEGIDLCFPYLLASQLVNIILLLGILALILCRLQSVDHHIKQKNWR